jgi:HEPN domain-containing protein
MNEESKLWFDFALEDLRVAEWTLSERLYNQTCFHAQQCVEKAIKCLLVLQGTVPPKTHDLNQLAKLLFLNPLTFLTAQIQSLDRFYVPTRYPDALPGALPEGLPTESHAREALETARQVIEIVGRTDDKPRLL